MCLRQFLYFLTIPLYIVPNVSSKVILFININVFYLFALFSYIQALAALINIYVAALNTPGTVPSVQSAWETFVHTKCSEAKLAALQVYESWMKSQLDGVLPCDSDDIRLVQQTAIEEGMKLFQGETFGVSATNSEKYLDELTVREQEDRFLALCNLKIHIEYVTNARSVGLPEQSLGRCSDVIIDHVSRLKWSLDTFINRLILIY